MIYSQMIAKAEELDAKALVAINDASYNREIMKIQNDLIKFLSRNITAQETLANHYEDLARSIRAEADLLDVHEQFELLEGEGGGI